MNNIYFIKQSDSIGIKFITNNGSIVFAINNA